MMQSGNLGYPLRPPILAVLHLQVKLYGIYIMYCVEVLNKRSFCTLKGLKGLQLKCSHGHRCFIAWELTWHTIASLCTLITCPTIVTFVTRNNSVSFLCRVTLSCMESRAGQAQKMMFTRLLYHFCPVLPNLEVEW